MPTELDILDKNPTYSTTTTNDLKETTLIENSTEERHAGQDACGVAMHSNIPHYNEQEQRITVATSHAVVEEGLEHGKQLAYRSGYNEITGESDGAGIKLHGFSSEFFNKKIEQGEFFSPAGAPLTAPSLRNQQFIIGQYFLPTAPELTQKAKQLIIKNAQANGLRVVGWRDLNSDAAIDKTILSTKSLEKKPAIWQAILLPDDEALSAEQLERAALKAGIEIYYESKQQQLAINILSQSSEAIVYKGMVRAQELGVFYKDLQDVNLDASATTFHARFATNTDPQWANAQPCVFFWSHNGELNSAPTNAHEMCDELNALNFKGVYPNARLSDSMQFDGDLANLMIIKNIPLLEAFVRLMPPNAIEGSDSAEINAMLQYFQLERTAYNGPAFAVAAHRGYFIAKLDAVGLRPSRWAIVEDERGYQQFYAASDDFVQAPPGGKIVQKGELEPGGMIVLTPEGKILKTADVLQKISERYHTTDPRFFQNQLQAVRSPLVLNVEESAIATATPTSHSDVPESHAVLDVEPSLLNRILYSSGWDHESVRQVLRYMAEEGAERVGAMGDDTNPLHSTAIPQHLSYFFHQLFAQVSAPPLDSVNELENFSLQTALGPTLGVIANTKQVLLESPMLATGELEKIENHPHLTPHVLDTTFHIAANTVNATEALSHAITQLLITAEKAAKAGGVLILSDKNNGPNQVAIPDLIAVAAVRRHLENKNLIRRVSIVADSYQINGPHQASTLLALGANAVYARGAYTKIKERYSDKNPQEKAANYRKALDKCLLKTMGKMGLTDVDNYINGHYIAALGLDLSNATACSLDETPTLANIFPSIYSPLKGINLSHVAAGILLRHQQAHNPIYNFSVLPYSGYYMPEKDGIKHGYGPEVVNAFTEWLKAEEMRSTLWRLHQILDKKGYPNFVSDTALFTPEQGFVDPTRKDLNGYYLPDEIKAFELCLLSEAKTLEAHKLYLEFYADTIVYTIKGTGTDDANITGTLNINRIDSTITQPITLAQLQPHAAKILALIAERGITQAECFNASAAFKKMEKTIDDYRQKYPTAIRDHFVINPQLNGRALRTFLKLPATSAYEAQTQAQLRKLLFAGSMSQGALTVTNPDNPTKIGAHETLTRGMNAVGSLSASGEGGEAPNDLRDESKLKTTRSKQIASGRFGVSAMQILCADEVEIKVAQGAKPGEGGQLPGLKVSVRFAAQRGGLPGTPFISPPPHHDIYSIEDLEQLIHDIKSVNPKTKVSVKLVASQGIGTIAVGVAKAGADVINIAGNSGGTGAAQQSSIKHAGLPAEIGLAEVDKALRQTKLRDLVKLRVSGGFKTAEDVILAAILGADLFEFGTTSMLTLGCKMQRTCDRSCQPGVATDGHLFKGDQLNTERYFLNIAASIQARLHELGVSSLEELKGRTELLQLIDLPPEVKNLYDFSPILKRDNLPPHLTVNELKKAQEQRQATLKRPLEDALIEEITAFFQENPNGQFHSTALTLTTQNRSFAARIAGAFAKHLEQHSKARITLNTQGEAGQSFGFVLPNGMVLHHQGPVQDGAGKSMNGGELQIKTASLRQDYRADENTIAGNALLYGASGGKAFINGVVGHRFGILCKGAQIVVEGTGDLAFEYMTSGTGMILGKTGKGLCASASGGIVFVYDKQQSQKHAKSVRRATPDESQAYESVIKAMLHEHVIKTGSAKAQEVLASFNLDDFKILIPKTLDQIKTLTQLMDIIKTYQLREAPITDGMRVWLETKALAIVSRELRAGASTEPSSPLQQLRALINSPQTNVFSKSTRNSLNNLIKKPTHSEDFGIKLTSLPQRKSSSPEEASTSSTTSSTGDLTVQIHRRAIKAVRPVEERLDNIDGKLDEILLDAFAHINAYVAEISHDAQGCSGCRAQSCAGGEDVDTGCPSSKQINRLNITLQQIGAIKNGQLTKQQWQTLREAFAIQVKESPFISYTGAACPAPCQDACTESIPDLGEPNPKRDGKLTGEPVHIKDIEYYLYQVGRALGWLDGQKTWSAAAIKQVFPDETVCSFATYQRLMQAYKAPFRQPEIKRPGKKLVIVGSGPAAMQMAYDALIDGVEVEMYEKSDKAGGLLVDGIPWHKFDKQYISDDFCYLEAMGLKLHLNAAVHYDASRQGFYINKDNVETMIARANDEDHHVALCVGAGKPKTLGRQITAHLPETHQHNIIQAVDLLKAKNDIVAALKADPNQDKEALIQSTLGAMDPRGKKVVVIGGGDTAQDVIRWVTRYFNFEAEEAAAEAEAEATAKQPNGELNILVRGPEPTATRGIQDAYPAPSKAPTKENKLRMTEVDYIQGDTLHQVAPTAIEVDETTGKLRIKITEHQFKYQNVIQSDLESNALWQALPREKRPLAAPCEQAPIENVDLVICALGFQGQTSIPLIKDSAGLSNVSIAGDAANVEPQIIVGAQASAHKTYHNKTRALMGISDASPSLIKPTNQLSALKTHSMFAARPTTSVSSSAHSTMSATTASM